MAFRLFGAKPLSKPMLGCCQLDPWEQISVKFNQNTIFFIHVNASENIVYETAAILSRGQWVNGSTMIQMLRDMIHVLIYGHIGVNMAVADDLGPFYLHGLTLIPAWISNYIPYKVWD